ncbi:MAG: hypothetical protein ACRELG_17970 [Gemmataceae bacterium]
MSHGLRRFASLAFMVFCAAMAVSADEAKKTPTLEEAYRTFHAGMASAKKEEQIKALKTFLPTRKDIDVLFPKHAAIVWKDEQAAQKLMIEHHADVAQEVTRNGPIKRIVKHDLRALKNPSKGYQRVLAMIPRDIPIYAIHVFKEQAGGGTEAFLLVNGRWIFFKDIDAVPERIDKAKEPVKKADSSPARAARQQPPRLVLDKKLADFLREQRKNAKPTKLSKREKRMLRWTRKFDTKNAEDYVQQMRALGAILAFPIKKGEYVVIRDLSKRPAEPKAEDIAKMNRIYWIDHKAESVRDVCTILGVKGSPDHFIAFFPEKLENQLHEKELKYKGLPEDDIEATSFRVFRRGAAWQVKVVEQKPDKR